MIQRGLPSGMIAIFSNNPEVLLAKCSEHVVLSAVKTKTERSNGSCKFSIKLISVHVRGKQVFQIHCYAVIIYLLPNVNCVEMHFCIGEWHHRPSKSSINE